MGALGHWYILLLVLLFWGGVIALVIWAIRSLSGSNRSKTPLAILKERFARGEIDQQEYENRKRALEEP